MALHNLVQQKTFTTGSGTITLGTTSTGFLSFTQAGVTNNEIVPYGIYDGNNSEVGNGTYSTSGTLTRSTILASTNNNNPINLSGGATVFITPNTTSFNSIGSGGYYASYYDTTNQSISNIGNAGRITFNSVETSSGVTRIVTSGTGTGVQFDNAGVYNVQFSVQYLNTDTQLHNSSIWMRVNDVDVSNSAGQSTIPNKHGGVNGQLIVGWNYVLSYSAGDIMELWWSVDNTSISLQTVAAGVNPIVPVSPSIILTATQIA